jgi:uncharacterized protein
VTLSQLLAGAAFVLALEGLAYACFPGVMRRAIGAVAAEPEATLRRAGLAAAIAGTALARALAWALA